MNGKAFATFNTWSFVGIFSDYMWRLKTLKNPYHLQKVKFKLSKKRKKTSIRKEKPRVTYSVALVKAFLAAENENRQLKAETIDCNVSHDLAHFKDSFSYWLL